MTENTNENETSLTLPVATRFDLGLENLLCLWSSDDLPSAEKKQVKMPPIENCKLYSWIERSKINSDEMTIELCGLGAKIILPQKIQISKNSILGLYINEAEFTKFHNPYNESQFIIDNWLYDKLRTSLREDSLVKIHLSEFAHHLECMNHVNVLKTFSLNNLDFSRGVFGSVRIYSDVDPLEVQKIKIKKDFDIYETLHEQLENIATQTIYLDRESMKKRSQ